MEEIALFTKIFTAIRCNLLSIEKQVDAPIIGLEIVCSKINLLGQILEF
jgi:hypothetical protein